MSWEVDSPWSKCGMSTSPSTRYKSTKQKTTDCRSRSTAAAAAAKGTEQGNRTQRRRARAVNTTHTRGASANVKTRIWHQDEQATGWKRKGG